MNDRTVATEVAIAGGGLAGLVAATELLDRGRKVVLFEKGTREKLGGLAKESFGGVHLIDTPHQRRMGIRDNPDLAYRDWESYAFFTAEDAWPRRWARTYCDHSIEFIYRFLAPKGVRFLPVVNWVERGVFRPGNSVPRWHIAWGTGHEIVDRVVAALEAHPRRGNLTILYDHEVSGFETRGGRVEGVTGRNLSDRSRFHCRADAVIVASGGICGGDLSGAREHWDPELGKPPRVLLNGAHDHADGLLHDQAARVGARLTHLERAWHYAAGVHHPARRRPHDGLSLVPPRSALWMNARGERIGPMPLVGYSDTRHLVASILKEPGQYSWQVMNRKIAVRELAVSGCDFMEAFRKKSYLKLFRQLLFGDAKLVDRLTKECPEDFVVASSLPELVEGMNRRSLFGHRVDAKCLERDLRDYDDQIDRGPRYYNDDQLRRLMNYRTYRGDRVRLCRFQKILDPAAMPLLAIREFILARKSLGGIQTDLQCRALDRKGKAIPGLYAVGESAGFGGGGIHGVGALEGTFLGSCVLTGRMAGRAIAGG